MKQGKERKQGKGRGGGEKRSRVKEKGDQTVKGK